MRPADARTRLGIQHLEDRTAPAAAELTGQEQYFLELLNRARANPAAEAARFGIDLNEGLPAGTISSAPAQPLAPNAQLSTAITGQIDYLKTVGRLSHTGADGSGPGYRISRTGYRWSGYGENLAYNGDLGQEQETADRLHQQLFVDSNVAGRGHRTSLMDGRYEEVGVDVSVAQLSWGPAAFTGQDFAASSAGPFLTGVAYTDSVIPDRFYSVGEGIGGASVVATAANGQAYRTTTTAAGGYALEVPAGTYQVAFTTSDGRSGGYTATVGSANVKVDFVPGTAPPVVPPPPAAKLPVAVVAGAPDGGSGAVRVLDPRTGKEAWSVSSAVPAGIGARVASADVTGDGIADVIVGTGPGTATQVKVIDGSNQSTVFAVNPFEGSFTGGVFVAAGDVTGDGRPDVVITPDRGGGPRVRVFDGNGFRAVADFWGIDDPNFRGGARAAIGDLDGDGTGDLVVAAGFQGGPRVAGYTGASVTVGRPQRVFGDFFAFEQTLRNGTFVAVGDVDADGRADLLVGGGPGGSPRVLALSGRDLAANRQTVLGNFFAGDANARDGARLAVKDADGDGRADVIVGTGSHVVAYPGRSISPNGSPGVAFDLDAFPGSFNGVYVG